MGRPIHLGGPNPQGCRHDGETPSRARAAIGREWPSLVRVFLSSRPKHVRSIPIGRDYNALRIYDDVESLQILNVVYQTG